MVPYRYIEMWLSQGYLGTDCFIKLEHPCTARAAKMPHHWCIVSSFCHASFEEIFKATGHQGDTVNPWISWNILVELLGYLGLSQDIQGCTVSPWCSVLLCPPQGSSETMKAWLLWSGGRMFASCCISEASAGLRELGSVLIP